MNTISRVNTAHTINAVALSVISIYVPVYLLNLGFSLSEVVIYFAIFHLSGLFFGIFVFPYLTKYGGLLNTFKIYYPLQMCYLFLLTILKEQHTTLFLIAILGGISNFAYWLPINIFFVKFSHEKSIGVNLSRFFALPNLFGIVGPIFGAIFIPFVGFWPVFLITIVGLFCSYIPLATIDDSSTRVDISFFGIVKRLKQSKTLFVFEFLDNIIEESEWFWSIYVYLIIGSLSTPGIVGSLEAIGGSLFTLLVGKFSDRYGKNIVPFAAIGLCILTACRVVVKQPVTAYTITLLASFTLTLFLVTYFSSVLKIVKDRNEEEFMIVREIPTVLGRMAVFGCILLTLHNLRFFFLLPLMTILSLILLYVWKGKKTFQSEKLEITLGTK